MMQVVQDNLPMSMQNLVLLGMIAAIFLAGIICTVVYFKTYARVPLAKGEGVLESREKNRAYIGTVPMVLAILYLAVETINYIEF